MQLCEVVVTYVRSFVEVVNTLFHELQFVVRFAITISYVMTYVSIELYKNGIFASTQSDLLGNYLIALRFIYSLYINDVLLAAVYSFYINDGCWEKN